MAFCFRARCAALALFVAMSGLSSSLFAQGGTTTTTTVTTQQIAGVAVDAEGVLKMHKFSDPGGRLSTTRKRAKLATLSPEVSRPCLMRKISLNRLEAAVAERLARGEMPDEEMQYLAGLIRLKYVFFYPETNDIVIAGPAEGWASDPSGRVLGIRSNSPVLELRDLIVALRAFPPQGGETPVISVSIDPTREGLANMQSFLRSIGRNLNPRQANLIAPGLRRALGLQVITVKGIPADTHFAQILVEADYRMKLIGIGLERTKVRDLKAYVDLVNPAVVAQNAMQRWYFVPNYECVRMSEDGLAMELVGNGVKLVNEDEVVRRDGTRLSTAKSSAAGQRFVRGFTEKYPELAKAVPVYAQLRNCIDMAVAAAFIQREDLYGQAGWSMETFGSEERFGVHIEHAPTRVESAVASIWKQRRLMTPIGGGVNIQPRLAFAADNALPDPQGELSGERVKVALDHLKPNQWWWD